MTPEQKAIINKWKNDYSYVPRKKTSKLHFATKNEVRHIPSIDAQMKVKFES